MGLQYFANFYVSIYILHSVPTFLEMQLCSCSLKKMAYESTWIVVRESCEEILLPIGLGLQMHLTQTVEHI